MTNLKTILVLLLASGTLTVLTLIASSLSTQKLRKSRPIVAVCNANRSKVVLPSAYDVRVETSYCDAPVVWADWVVECVNPNHCNDLDLSTGLVNGYCSENWGVAQFPKSIECVRPTQTLSLNSTRIQSGIKNFSTKKVFATLLVQSNKSSERYLSLAIQWANTLISLSVSPQNIVIFTTEKEYMEKMKHLGIKMKLISKISSIGTLPGYADMLTKAHLWNATEYEQIAYYDTDFIFLRSPSVVFEECGSARLCAVPDRVFHQIHGNGYFNAGMMVIRPATSTFQYIIDNAVKAKSAFAEQDMFNQIFDWKQLPTIYNWQHVDISDDLNNCIALHIKPWESKLEDELLRGLIEEQLQFPNNVFKFKQSRAFIHIPKTGGTSIEDWGRNNGRKWGRYEPLVGIEATTPLQIKRCAQWHIPPKYKFYKEKKPLFTVLRDPIERAFSQAVYKIKYEKGDPSKNKPKTCEDVDAYIVSKISDLRDGILGKYDDCHWLPQSEYVSHVNGTRFKDLTLLNFETLSQDFKKSTGGTLPHSMSTNNACNIHEHMSNETKLLVRNTYKDDYQLLKLAILQTDSDKDNSQASLSVISHCTRSGKRYTKELQEASFANKQRWCDAVGVECFLHKHEIHDPHDAHLGRGKQWDKVISFRDVLKTLPNNTWLLWLDCDAIFTSKTLETFYKLTDTKKEVIFNKDCNGFNFGVFLMKRTNWTLTFLDRIYEGITTETNSNAEQTYVSRLIKQDPDVQNKIKWVDQKLMNSYYMNSCGAQWSEGDWILHQVFCHRQPICNNAFVSVANKKYV